MDPIVLKWNTLFWKFKIKQSSTNYYASLMQKTDAATCALLKESDDVSCIDNVIHIIRHINPDAKCLRIVNDMSASV